MCPRWGVGTLVLRTEGSLEEQGWHPELLACACWWPCEKWGPRTDGKWGDTCPKVSVGKKWGASVGRSKEQGQGSAEAEA